MAAATEEMSANVLAVSAAMEQSASNVHMVASAAEEMTATVSEIAQNAERARSITESAGDAVAGSLGENGRPGRVGPQYRPGDGTDQ